MGAHLITGYAGKEHITSADQGAYNAGTVGNGKYVFPTGSQFAYEIVSNNLIKIRDGNLIDQGRHMNIAANDYAEVVLDNGIQGLKRNDLIVMRYSKNVETDIEDAEVVLIKGVSGDTAADPSYVTGDILNGDTMDDFPLYRVRLDGTNIDSVDKLFTPIQSLKSVGDLTGNLSDEINHVNDTLDAKISQVQQSLGNEINTVQQSLGNEINTVQQSLGNEINTVQQSLGNEINTVQQSLSNKIDYVEGSLSDIISNTKNQLQECITNTEDELSKKINAEKQSLSNEINNKLSGMVSNCRLPNKSFSIDGNGSTQVKIPYTIISGYAISGVLEVRSSTSAAVIYGYSISNLSGSGTVTVYLGNRSTNAQTGSVAVNLGISKISF